MKRWALFVLFSLLSARSAVGLSAEAFTRTPGSSVEAKVLTALGFRLRGCTYFSDPKTQTGASHVYFETCLLKNLFDSWGENGFGGRIETELAFPLMNHYVPATLYWRPPQRGHWILDVAATFSTDDDIDIHLSTPVVLGQAFDIKFIQRILRGTRIYGQLVDLIKLKIRSVEGDEMKTRVDVQAFNFKVSESDPLLDMEIRTDLSRRHIFFDKDIVRYSIQGRVGRVE